MVRAHPARSLLLFAFSDSFAFVGFNGIYQRRTPDAIRGRVFAAVGAVMTFAAAASFGFAGFLVDAVGWRCGLTSAAAWWTSPARWRWP